MNFLFYFKIFKNFFYGMEQLQQEQQKQNETVNPITQEAIGNEQEPKQEKEKQTKSPLSQNQNSIELQGIAEPINPTGWQLMGKTITWLVTWFLIALVIFLVIMMLGSEKFMENAGPLLPFLLILITFICTLIGNTIIVGAYNLFFPEKYYDFWKMFGFILLWNWLILFLFVFVYFMGNTKDISILMIVAFHVLFSIYVAYNFIEFLPNPQYSGSAFVGNTLWFVLGIVIYLAIFNLTKHTADKGTVIYNLMIWPSILWYTLIPLIGGIWQKIYYRFYEMGNNFFYLPTEAEVNANLSTEEEKNNHNEAEEINVET